MQSRLCFLCIISTALCPTEPIGVTKPALRSLWWALIPEGSCETGVWTGPDWRVLGAAQTCTGMGGFRGFGVQRVIEKGGRDRVTFTTNLLCPCFSHTSLCCQKQPCALTWSHRVSVIVNSLSCWNNKTKLGNIIQTPQESDWTWHVNGGIEDTSWNWGEILRVMLFFPDKHPIYIFLLYPHPGACLELSGTEMAWALWHIILTTELFCLLTRATSPPPPPKSRSPLRNQHTWLSYPPVILWPLQLMCWREGDLGGEAGKII